MILFKGYEGMFVNLSIPMEDGKDYFDIYIEMPRIESK
jgi:hypothetical protein